MQKLGQHFLKNKTVIEKIIAEIDVQKNDTVIEIGSGHGELTLSLIKICEEIGASLIAIEKDNKLYERLNTLTIGKINLIEGDVLKILPEIVAGLVEKKITNYKIVGNIPYYLTGYLLRVVSEFETKPEYCIFMIQEEVAERICAVPPKMNRLAASVQFWADPSIVMEVPKKDFSPPPEVDSSVIKLLTKTHPLKKSASYFAGVRALFAQPRKTILNNISDHESQTDKKKDEISKILKEIGIHPEDRAQNLTIEQIFIIATRFF